MRKESYEDFVHQVLAEVCSKYPHYTLERQYSNHECKNKKRLRFDFAITFRGKPLFFVEVMEKHHFSSPNKRSFITRTVDNLTTFLLRENDFLKWKYQEQSGIPIVYVNQHEYDVTDYEKLVEYLEENIRFIEEGYRMAGEDRRKYFQCKYFAKLPAERVNIPCLNNSSEFNHEIRMFAELYNKRPVTVKTYHTFDENN